MSRVSHVMLHPDGAAAMTEAVRGALDGLVGELAAEAAARLVEREGCEVIALAQFSLARAAPRVAERCGVPVLTTVDSAVRALRQRLAA